MINALGGVSNLWTGYLWFLPPHYYAAFGWRKFPFLHSGLCSTVTVRLARRAKWSCWIVWWLSPPPSQTTSSTCGA